jgi:hypothetical protein
MAYSPTRIGEGGIAPMEWRRNKVICAGAVMGIHHAASRCSKQGIISDDLELRYVIVMVETFGFAVAEFTNLRAETADGLLWRRNLRPVNGVSYRVRADAGLIHVRRSLFFVIFTVAALLFADGAPAAPGDIDVNPYGDPIWQQQEPGKAKVRRHVKRTRPHVRQVHRVRRVAQVRHARRAQSARQVARARIARSRPGWASKRPGRPLNIVPPAARTP